MMTTVDIHIVVNMSDMLFDVARMDEHSSCSNAVMAIIMSIDDRVTCDDNR